MYSEELNLRKYKEYLDAVGQLRLKIRRHGNNAVISTKRELPVDMSVSGLQKNTISQKPFKQLFQDD